MSTASGNESVCDNGLEPLDTEELIIKLKLADHDISSQWHVIKTLR